MILATVVLYSVQHAGAPKLHWNLSILIDTEPPEPPIFGPLATMDFSSIKEQVSNLSLYDLKAGVRKVQNGKLIYQAP